MNIHIVENYYMYISICEKIIGVFVDVFGGESHSS